MSHPLVSAIVLNFRSRKDSVRCVDALLRQDGSAKLEARNSNTHSRLAVRDSGFIEVLLIDNHSCDDSIQYLRNRYRTEPRVKIIETKKNLGYGQGNMAAHAHAQGEFLLIINPDNEVTSGSIEQMVELMEKDPEIGILAPKLVHPDGSIRDSARRFPTIWDIIQKRMLQRNKTLHSSLFTLHSNVDWIAGACFLIRKKLFEELGGFDPRYFLFLEDTDLCRRVWKAGKKVMYAPEITVLDRKERLSEGGILSLVTKKTARIHLVSGIRYFMKWGFRQTKS